MRSFAVGPSHPPTHVLCNVTTGMIPDLCNRAAYLNLPLFKREDTIGLKGARCTDKGCAATRPHRASPQLIFFFSAPFRSFASEYRTDFPIPALKSPLTSCALELPATTAEIAPTIAAASSGRARAAAAAEGKLFVTSDAMGGGSVETRRGNPPTASKLASTLFLVSSPIASSLISASAFRSSRPNSCSAMGA